ncbi:hypothetical protein ADK41_00790 [Streptomyces caelestis]|uniref:Transcriptional regulator n=1 Tax=Streptomyces caelestis TaxID=36816 RepID=A0A0M8QN74_9ACTN|nr:MULTISPECIES: hypothetical protein [Streptomyces]KOT46767.1 hypothetical protein ADK41_00790 [Streptomyces caelestis]
MRRATRFRQLVEENHWTVFATFCIHFQRAARDVARIDGDPRLAAVTVSSRSFDRWMAGDLKRMPWPPTCRVLEHLLGEPAVALFGSPIGETRGTSDDAASEPAGQGMPAAALAPLLALPGATPAESTGPFPYLGAVESFRHVDRQLGAGHVYSSLQQYLQTSIAVDLFEPKGRPHSADVFLAAAVLTEMAGWMAHDLGRNAEASEHFTMAFGLAHATPEPSVGANVLASTSHLALQLGNVDQALSLARRGHERMANIKPIPVLTARLHAMEGRAQAQLGDDVAAQRALEAAGAALEGASTAPAPHWVAPFDQAALASESALALRDLGMLSAATAEAERAVALRGEDRARSRAFSQSALAALLVQNGDLEAACATGVQLLTACEPLGSSRITEHLHAFKRALAPFHGVPQVRDLLEQLSHVNRRRSALLASFDARPGTSRRP